MSQDKASAIDYVEAGLAADVVPPAFPCPTCSKETKDANIFQDNVDGKKLRICSDAGCRAKADWSSGSAVLLNN